MNRTLKYFIIMGGSSIGAMIMYASKGMWQIIGGLMIAIAGWILLDNI